MKIDFLYNKKMSNMLVSGPISLIFDPGLSPDHQWTNSLLCNPSFVFFPFFNVNHFDSKRKV